MHSFVDLPVQKILPRIDRALADNGSAVLVAPPGSGKTTLVPLALKDASWLAGKKILMLEPRRLAARLAAGYMSRLLGEKVGNTIGYQVRFDRCISPLTRVEVITEGMLTRRLQQDPELAGVGLVIFDEFHERSLDLDLALALCLDVVAGLRDDLRLLVMSATLDAESVSSLLGKSPVIVGQGRVYPVAVEYLPPPAGFDTARPDHIARSTARAIRRILASEQGDMLVFLPGVGEIKRVRKHLRGSNDQLVYPLHGGLSPAEQDKAIVPDPAGRQRIILATTIAETSVTIEGIAVVVDSGWKRVPRFHAGSGLTRLDTVRISRASAEQRAGRAGRLGPGRCYRLWNMGVEAGLQEFDQPEIRQADLAGLVLEMAGWGVHDPVQLSWLDPPPAVSFQQGRALLIRLGALDGRGRITGLGRAMLALPLHPRLAGMVLRSGRVNRKDALDLAALLSERDFLPEAESADLEDRVHCLHRFRRQGRNAVSALGGNPGVCRQVDQVSRQLTARLKKVRAEADQERFLSLGGLLALAYPDRIAARRSRTGHSYKLVSGRGGRLPDHDPLAASDWLVAASQDVGRRDGRIFLAAAIEFSEVKRLFQQDMVGCDEVWWDSSARMVVSRCCIRLGELLVTEKKVVDPDPAAVQKALIQGIQESGLDSLAWSAAAEKLRDRVCCLREWQPEAGWPDFSGQALLDELELWLSPYLSGLRTLKSCSSLDLERILRDRLDFSQQQRLNRDAPTHIQVPSGSRIPLRYQPGQPPVLAVRLQEMFGLAETPAVCRGKVQVLLHLLSPAGRPVQVTRDLRGFWDIGYFAVRRELKGRYPRHHWPEEPWKAEATPRAKHRKNKKTRG